MVEGRSKLKLGDFFNLTNFGVNITKLAPGAISALFHKHSRSDELVYILEGQPTLYLGVENSHCLQTSVLALRQAMGKRINWSIRPLKR